MKKFYLTTTLPYVNADPHIGFALEIIQADVIARYKREEGYDVFFNTGVDEHGQKIYQKAQDEGKDVQSYVDEYALIFDNLKKALNLSYNSFIRTTEKRHIKAAQEFWRRCEKNGDIYKKNYKTKYCIGCEMEKTDSELENDRCPIHPNRDLEIREEENYFFKYSKYQERLLDLYNKDPLFVVPSKRFKEIYEFTKRGLKDFSISRLKTKMPWGVEVPGDPDHVMYVWFDALVNYISCDGWPDDGNYWPGIQFAGKDNLRQQSSMWQAMLMSAGVPNSKQIIIHGFVTSNGQKMSKSLGNVVNPYDLVEKYGADALRYYLLRELTPFEDGDYTENKFIERYNADLANGLGNLLSRSMTLANKLDSKEELNNDELKELIEDKQTRIDKHIKGYNFNLCLTHIWGIVSYLNKYIEEERPWEDKDKGNIVISNVLYGLREISKLLKPFLPETSEKICKTLDEKSILEPLFSRVEKV